MTICARARFNPVAIGNNYCFRALKGFR
jgi:hypothetical protein